MRALVLAAMLLEFRVDDLRLRAASAVTRSGIGSFGRHAHELGQPLRYLRQALGRLPDAVDDLAADRLTHRCDGLLQLALQVARHPLARLLLTALGGVN